ncbi:hypothetical protein [Streptomyces sp. NPDC006638]|uniref:hypothetical protein n=1 Tax=Streptomyces sp. NPDC006638 TaxID=3157183 RepID=UPI0033B37330
MKNLIRRFKECLDNLTFRALIALQVFATTEPVRLRAALVSVVMAGAVLFPALASEQLAQSIAGVIVVALPLVAGEGTRRKVSPTYQ